MYMYPGILYVFFLHLNVCTNCVYKYDISLNRVDDAENRKRNGVMLFLY